MTDKLLWVACIVCIAYQYLYLYTDVDVWNLKERWRRMTDVEITAIEKFLRGKKIIKAEVDGFGIKLKFSDKSEFEYEASDGGYSMWNIIQGKDGDSHDPD